MKTILLLLSSCFLSVALLAQSLQTSISITLPNMVAEDKAYSEFVKADLDQELNVDDVFDKMALIESRVFSEDELHAKREKHMLEAGEVMFFQHSNH